MPQLFRYRRIKTSLALAASVFATIAVTNAFAITAESPIVTSIARLQPGPLTTADTVTWRVTFDGSVVGVDTSDFALTRIDGSATGMVSLVNGTGTEYTVTASSLSGVGTLRLDLRAGDTGIVYSARTSTSLTVGFTFGQSYTHIHGSAPVAWGGQQHGQFGNNTTSTWSNTPTGVLTSGALKGKVIVAISLGEYHCLALTSDGQVFAWGDNDYGQLGNNSTTDSAVPVAATMTGALSGKTVVAIAAGVLHSLALTSDGRVFAWGYNYSGAFGDGSSTSSSVPVPVATTGALAGKTIIAITAGFHQSLALSSDGKAYAWGFNISGQLGAGYIGLYSAEPVAVYTSGALAGKNIVAIAGTGQYSLALSNEGRVYTWGKNDFGQLGTGSADSYSDEPVAVKTSGVLAGKTIVAIAAGPKHSAVLTSDGLICTWGYNDRGQLGNNSTTASNEPVAVTMTGALSSKTVVGITANGGNSLARTSDGAMCYWGIRYTAFTGDSSANLTPVAVDASSSTNSALAGRTVYSLGMDGYSHVCFALASPFPISSVTVPAASWYKESNALTFTVSFPQAVAVDTTSGTPRIALTIGSATRYAAYVSGTGTTALTFSYMVQAGDADSDGIVVARTTIDLNSGGLTDVAGNAVDLTLPTLDTSGIRIDTAAPDTSIISTPATSTTNTSASFSFSGSDTGGSGLASYQVQFNNGGFFTATSPVSYSGLAFGLHTFQVRAVDAAGNPDATPASHTWSVVTSGSTIPDGYAAAATGGGTTTAVAVSTATDFVTQATSTTARVITIVGTLDIGTVAVASNKTIQGADANSTLLGRLSLTGVSNVIIRGLNLATDTGSALTLNGASNVFITHCTFLDCEHDQLTLRGNTDKVTVSWCEFAAAVPGRQASVRVGDGTTTLPMHVTFHHNWWSRNLAGALPYITSGYLHQYSDHLDCEGSVQATVAGNAAHLLSERNVYTNMYSPLTKSGAGAIRAIDNVYTAFRGTPPDAGTDMVFTPSYSYEMLATSELTRTVEALAGNTAGATSTDVAPGTASITGPAAAVAPGSAATLTAMATGFTGTAYQWRLNNVVISGATSSTFTIASMSSTQAGHYTVAISLADGSLIVSAPLLITVEGGPNPGIVSISGPTSPVAPGASATLTAQTVGFTVTSYLWRLNDTVIPGATGPTYVISNMSNAQVGSYYVGIREANGIFVLSAPLEVRLGANTGTASITGPTTAVIPGAAATLTAVPSGFIATAYQWRLNNAAVSGATSDTYTIASMSSAHSGTYTVAISQADGTQVVSTPLTVSLGTSTNPGTGTNTGGSTSSGSGGGGALGSWLLAALAFLAASHPHPRRTM